MNPPAILDIIAANREYLMQSSRAALANLAELHKNFDQAEDEACILSLALNDSIAHMLFGGDYTKAIVNSNTALERFPQSTYTYFIARHLATVGRCQALLGQYNAAGKTLDKAKLMGNQLLHDAQKYSADVLHDLAMASDMAQSDPAISSAYLEEAMKILDNTDLEIRKGLCLNGLGNIKFSADKIQEALTYYLQAAAIFEDQYNSSNLASAYTNICMCYMSLEQMDEAEQYLNKSLDIRLRIGNSDEIARVYYNQALIHERNKNTDAAFSALITCRNYLLKNATTKLYADVLERLEKMALMKNDTVNAELFHEERTKVL
jgi:tetratricopeptide (TPR) repeat protein